MERRFSMDDFEESLKEHADDFKMIPSKRVWHGIYNDLHPGRRWPSVAMSLLLVFTLVVVGHLNTHTGSHVHNIEKGYFPLGTQNPEISATAAANSHNNISNNNNTIFKADNLKTGRKAALSQQPISRNLRAAIASSDYENNNSPITDNVLPGSPQMANRLLSKKLKNDNKTISQNNNVAISQNNAAPAVESSTITPQNKKAILQPSAKAAPSLNVDDNNAGNTELNSKINIPKYNTSKIDFSEKNIDLNNTYTIKADIQADKNKSILSAAMASDKEQADKSVTTKLPAENITVAKTRRKKNPKTSWAFYGAPEINSVSFRGQPIKPAANPALSPSVAINQKQNRIIYNSAFGFEAGTQFNYGITKKLMFTLGLQATYSGYKIVSNQVHPTLSTLMLKDAKTGVIYSRNYLTHYGDGTGLSVVPLRNYSFQASLPLGLQYQLFGNKKLQFSTAANLEPSLILKSNAYLLSSDGANYINDPSLLRKWNMSSNFGLFVTFHSNKLKWQIGPNVRYQWLSTYKKDYTVQEHLIDYGLRIGISK